MKLSFFFFLFLNTVAYSQQDSTLLIRRQGESDTLLNERAAKILGVRDYRVQGPFKGKTGRSDHFIVTGYNSGAIVLLHLDSATGRTFKAYYIDFGHNSEYQLELSALFFANADLDPEKEMGFLVANRFVAHDEEGNRIYNADYFCEFYEFNSGDIIYLEEISNKLEGYDDVSSVKKRLKELGY